MGGDKPTSCEGCPNAIYIEQLQTEKDDIWKAVNCLRDEVSAMRIEHAVNNQRITEIFTTLSKIEEAIKGISIKLDKPDNFTKLAYSTGTRILEYAILGGLFFYAAKLGG